MVLTIIIVIHVSRHTFLYSPPPRSLGSWWPAQEEGSIHCHPHHVELQGTGLVLGVGRVGIDVCESSRSVCDPKSRNLTARVSLCSSVWVPLCEVLTWSCTTGGAL